MPLGGGSLQRPLAACWGGGGGTPHHTTPHQTTQHNTTLSTPQLYPRAGCRVRSPGRQGPGTANSQCTNSVGCVHVPVPSTIPRDPAAPSTGRLGPENGQRPLARTAGQASPSSPPNTPAHTRGPQQSPAMRPPPPPRPCLCPPPPPPDAAPAPRRLPCPVTSPSLCPFPPLTGWQRPGGAPPGPRIGGRPRRYRASATRRDRDRCGGCTCGQSSEPGLCLAGVANRQTNLAFRHTGTGVLADDTHDASSERLLGRADDNAGVLKTGAAGPRLGGAPVELSFPSASWSVLR